MFDDEHRVALVAEAFERVEEHAGVAVVQTDGRFVEDVADAAEVRAELGGEADALAFAAAERWHGAVEGEVAEADFLQEREARADVGDDARCDGRLARAELEFGEVRRRFGDGHLGEVRDSQAVEAEGPRLRVEARPAAVGAGLGAVAVERISGGIGEVERLAAVFGERLPAAMPAACGEAVAVAGRAAAAVGVEREEARIGLFEARGAGRAGARRRGDVFLLRRRRAALRDGQDAQDAASVFERLLDRDEHLLGGAAADREARDGQVDVVLLVAGGRLPGVGVDPGAVDAQGLVAALVGPGGEFFVDAFATGDETGEQDHVATGLAFQQVGEDLLGRLAFDGAAAVRAVLDAEDEEEQAQVVVDLRDRGDGALPSALADALLNRDRGRQRGQRQDVRLRLGLDELPRIGVEAFEVAALAGGEEDVERERGLAGAADAGDDGEGVEGDVHVDVAEVVLVRAAHRDGRRARGGAVAFGGLRGDGVGIRGRGAAQRGAGVAVGVRRDVVGRSGSHDAAAGLAAFGTEVDDVVGGAHDHEVVFDHDDGVAAVHKPSQDGVEDLDVGEVEPRRGFVEDEERAAAL